LKGFPDLEAQAMLDAKNSSPFHCVFAKKYKTSYPLVKYVSKVQ
jgi:hypothetical protein